MTLEQIDKEILSDEEKLEKSLSNYKMAKIEYRKAKITVISNKLLAPFRKFKINLNIAKYDIMLEKIERKRLKEIEKANKLQKLENKKRTADLKKDFKKAIRNKQSEEVEKFIDDKKTAVINSVSSIKCKISNVKNNAINVMKNNSAIDLIVLNKIDDMKIKYATNKYNNTLKKKLDSSFAYESNVPFVNIKDKVSKASSKCCYMGRSTNRALAYVKSNYDSISKKVNDKILDLQINASLKGYLVIAKVSSKKSKIVTVFNNKINEKKNKIRDIRSNEMKKREIKKSQLESLKNATLALKNEMDNDIVFSNTNLKTI